MAIYNQSGNGNSLPCSHLPLYPQRSISHCWQMALIYDIAGTDASLCTVLIRLNKEYILLPGRGKIRKSVNIYLNANTFVFLLICPQVITCQTVIPVCLAAFPSADWITSISLPIIKEIRSLTMDTSLIDLPSSCELPPNLQAV